MKLIFILLLATSPFISYAQVTDFKVKYGELVQDLQKEDWVTAENLSASLLKYAEANDSLITEKKVLRYIYIYSVAGSLSEGWISKDKALAKIEYLKGKEMMMPAHPFHANCYINCMHLSDSAKNTFSTFVNNARGTTILSFEYVTIKDGIKETREQLEDKYIVLTGVLDNLFVEGNMFPRFRLMFINGKYDFFDPE